MNIDEFLSKLDEGDKQRLKTLDVNRCTVVRIGDGEMATVCKIDAGRFKILQRIVIQPQEIVNIKKEDLDLEFTINNLDSVPLKKD